VQSPTSPKAPTIAAPLRAQAQDRTAGRDDRALILADEPIEFIRAFMGRQQAA